MPAGRYSRATSMRFPILLVSLVYLAGCGGGSAGGASSGPTETSSAGGEAPRSSSRAPVHPALAPLRPAGADDVLAAIERAPRAPAAYARAAAFFADTDVAGMTLVYGLSHVAMGGEPSEVAGSMARVLRERITTTPTERGRRVSTRLAPGSMPAIAAEDGSMSAPVAHVLEVQLLPTLAAFDGQWTLPQIAAALSGYASGRGAPLDARLELQRWLAELVAAGHVEGLVGLAFGPAFPDELATFEAASTPGAIDAARAWIAAHPFRPSRPVLPDDLVRIR